MLPAGWQPKRHLAGFPFVSSFVNKSERVSSEVIPAETERAGSRGHDHRHSLPHTVLPYYKIVILASRESIIESAIVVILLRYHHLHRPHP